MEAFGEAGEVAVNKPFKGGHVSTSHYEKKRIPWIQIEINRKLYLTGPYFDEKKLTLNKQRIQELNSRFFSIIEKFSSLYF